MVTMLYAFIDVNSNMLHLANAGHNYPLLLNGSLEEIKLPGLPLGIDDGIEYEEKVIEITPGTSVIFYTDGVVEAMDSKGDLYTFERLKEFVADKHDLDAMEMVDKILEEVAIFTTGAAQSDDITVVVLQYHPQTSPEEQIPTEDNLVGALAESPGKHTEVELDDDNINWI